MMRTAWLRIVRDTGIGMIASVDLGTIVVRITGIGMIARVDLGTTTLAESHLSIGRYRIANGQQGSWQTGVMIG